MTSYLTRIARAALAPSLAVSPRPLVLATSEPVTLEDNAIPTSPESGDAAPDPVAMTAVETPSPPIVAPGIAPFRTVGPAVVNGTSPELPPPPAVVFSDHAHRGTDMVRLRTRLDAKEAIGAATPRGAPATPEPQEPARPVAATRGREADARVSRPDPSKRSGPPVEEIQTEQAGLTLPTEKERASPVAATPLERRAVRVTRSSMPTRGSGASVPSVPQSSAARIDAVEAGAAAQLAREPDSLPDAGAATTEHSGPAPVVEVRRERARPPSDGAWHLVISAPEPVPKAREPLPPRLTRRNSPLEQAPGSASPPSGSGQSDQRRSPPLSVSALPPAPHSTAPPGSTAAPRLAAALTATAIPSARTEPTLSIGRIDVTVVPEPVERRNNGSPKQSPPGAQPRTNAFLASRGLAWFGFKG